MIERVAALQFGILSCDDAFHLRVGHAEFPDHRVVEQLYARRECAHRHFGLKREAEFSHHDYVERQMQIARRLRGDDHAAARHSEDDRVVQLRHAASKQFGGERVAGGGS